MEEKREAQGESGRMHRSTKYLPLRVCSENSTLPAARSPARFPAWRTCSVVPALSVGQGQRQEGVKAGQ